MAERKPVVLVGGQLLELPSGDTLPATPPTGSAGGVLSGSFPNPGFAVDMATQGELDALATTVGGKAAASHSHAISDVSGLQTALDGKQPTLSYKITVSTTEPSSPATGDIWISY